MATQSRFGASEKRQVLKVVEQARARTGWTVRRVLRHLSLTKSRYYEWKRREEEALLDDLVPGARASPHALRDRKNKAPPGSNANVIARAFSAAVPELLVVETEIERYPKVISKEYFEQRIAAADVTRVIDFIDAVGDAK